MVTSLSLWTPIPISPTSGRWRLAPRGPTSLSLCQVLGYKGRRADGLQVHVFQGEGVVWCKSKFVWVYRVAGDHNSVSLLKPSWVKGVDEEASPFTLMLLRVASLLLW